MIASPEDLHTSPPRSFRAIALIVLIVGVTMTLLSGLCSGLMILTSIEGATETPDLSASALLISLIAIAFGALGVVPGLILFGAGLRLRSDRPRVIYGLIMITVGAPTAFAGVMLESLNDKIFSTGGLILAWGSLLTCIGGIWVILVSLLNPHKKSIQAFGEAIIPPDKRDIKAHAKTFMGSTDVHNIDAGNPSLNLTAKIIFWIAATLIIISLLGTAALAFSGETNIIPLILVEAVFLGLLAWLAYAMERHIKQGLNLFTEITAILFGLLTLALGGIGLLLIGWGIWSFVIRRKSKSETSNDPSS